MNIQHLKYAREVERCGSINKAAHNLGITQPYLSNCLKSLEKSIGVTLFKRSARGMEATPEGCEFLSIARDLIAKSDELAYKFNVRQPNSKTFKIATVNSIIAMQAAIDFFRQGLGQSEFRYELMESSFLDMVDSVYYYNANIGIIFYYTQQKDFILEYLSDKNLKLVELCAIPIHMLVSKKHPLAHLDVIRGNRLEQYPFITLANHMEAVSSIISECNMIGTRIPKRIIYLRDRDSLTYALNNTDGYMISHRIVPSACETNNLVCIPIKGTKSKVHYGYIAPRKIDLTDDAPESRFINILMDKLSQVI